MKNYNYWIIGVVILLLIVFVSGKKTDNGQSLNTDQVATTTTETKTDASKTVTTKKTTATPTPKPVEFVSIFASSKGNYQCVYEEVTPSRRTTNVIYFSEGKMRGEFRELGGSSNIMVYDGRNLYAWTEGKSTGVVSVPKSISDFPAIIPKDINEGKVLGSGLNNVSWDCFAWTKNAALLAKPTYVTFN